jgi:hypothetical protein
LPVEASLCCPRISAEAPAKSCRNPEEVLK